MADNDAKTPKTQSLKNKSPELSPVIEGAFASTPPNTNDDATVLHHSNHLNDIRLPFMLDEFSNMFDSQGKNCVQEPNVPNGPAVNNATIDYLGAGARVQFARSDAHETQPSHSRHESFEYPDNTKTRSSLIISKLKSLTPTSLHSPKTLTTDQDPFSTSPAVARFAARVPETLHEGDSNEEGEGDADADVDETADEAQIRDTGKKPKKKRRMRRFVKGDGSQPTSPFRFPNNDGEVFGYNRFLRRRASMPDSSMPTQVLSEGEQPQQPKRRPFARRGHSWMNATMMQPEYETEGADTSPVAGRRTGFPRRTTVLGGGGGASDGDGVVQRRPFFNSERASNFGAQKWKQVKSTLKLLRQKKEDRIDYYKSAELMAELRAGAPAVLMFASMIQRDEHGNKRIPVLLEQLKLKIIDSSPVPDDDKERHWNFTMELEYGSGPSRMVWTIVRTIRDIYNLHFRYKFALNNDKYLMGRLDIAARLKQPKFPYSVFPYLRRARNKGDTSDDEEAASGREQNLGEANEATVPTGDDVEAEATASDGGGNRHPRRKKSRVNMLGIRRRSTGFTDNGEGPGTNDGSPEAMRQRYVEKQRRILEKYLSDMIRWLMFRADSNRLCRFLELSALGVRLAAEGSYHGKEGYLHIQSAKGLDFRRVLTPARVIARHSRKWFLVRQSYIACVDSPENMNIYDVYLVDSTFSIISKKSGFKQTALRNKDSIDLTTEALPSKHHTLTLRTSERKVRLFSRYHAVMKQFEESITQMLTETIWSERKRFDSFAPVRSGVFAQWLVDGRDYMWNVSRALHMAKDVIYIHDWWLSPELYMRRPAAISHKWRLDRLLQKKASEGVKIFVIIYRNVEAAIPIDSEYTKASLLNLHPNIFIQRSPNQFKKNQFFFAHHEKICIVDHDVAFVGGIDLCFGRWDSPQHPIVDDKPTGFEISNRPKDAEHCQLFPGKDYSNPRVQDFFRLSEPYEEMYDRSKVPRMPWHDVGVQLVGQPSRDLTRHFVQRWNYLRRGRKSSRPLPFLLPPPDATFEELHSLGLTGSCEVQMLRSASNWSLGLEETEQSIQTAYVRLIEESEHFVYIENQFFITSTEAYNTRITNRIGDSLVDRIIRAHEKGESWRCVIIIPLMPGFQNTVDEQEGTSVRLIIMCQFKSICRGEKSIFGRLRAAGIDPDDYIDFFSLRQWGIMSTEALVTEQLYIHAKTMIVDDRVAIIGSANINERSMVGHRDSECAALVRDTDMIDSTMAGEPYKVGRFSYTLRMRLMREHLGLDVDEILEEENQEEALREIFERQMDEIYEEQPGQTNGETLAESSQAARGEIHEDNRMSKSIDSDTSPLSKDKVRTGNDKKITVDSVRYEKEMSSSDQDRGGAAGKADADEGRDSVLVEGHIDSVDSDGRGSRVSHQTQEPRDLADENKHLKAIPETDQLPELPPLDLNAAHLDDFEAAQLPTLPESSDADIIAPGASETLARLAADIEPTTVDKDCMADPIKADFIDGIWNKVARNNTKLFRKVFRCMPDSEVKTWPEYRACVAYGKRFHESMEGRTTTDEPDGVSEGGSNQKRPASGGGIGISVPNLEALAKASGENTEKLAATLSDNHADAHTEGGTAEEDMNEKTIGETGTEEKMERKTTTFPAAEKTPSKDTTATTTPTQFGSVKKRRRAATKSSRRLSISDEMLSRADAEGLLKMIQGNLVHFPYDWLIAEENNGNWGYQVDSVAPLAIYN